MSEETKGVRGRRVVVAGATSASGAAVCSALAGAGATVIAVGTSAAKLDALRDRVPGIRTEVCDLGDSAAVDALAGSVGGGGSGGDGGSGVDGVDGVDGLIHLVGGWVGGAGVPGQTDEAWEAMERGFRTLRNTTRAFYPALLASDAGRVAFVSSTTVNDPTASGASYTASKAAGESWMRSVADGFRRDAASRATGLTSAATIFVVKALVDESMRAADPDRSFPGYTDVSALAEAVVTLWTSPASVLNGSRILLTAG